MIRKASPWIERQTVVCIGTACRSVCGLRWKRDFRQGLDWRNFFGPIDRGILDRACVADRCRVEHEVHIPPSSS